MIKVIGIMGAAGSGKDTVAGVLVENHGFKKLSFAKTLKDIASVAFNWDRSLLEGDTPESRVWRETLDPFWGVTPRSALQKIGTEMFRENISPDFWIKRMHQDVMSSECPVVISDCRFENEAAFIQSLPGGVVIYVQRDEAEAKVPEWIREAARGPGAHEKLKDCGVHPSEWVYFGVKHDVTIHNNSSLEDLKKQVVASLGSRLAPSSQVGS